MDMSSISFWMPTIGWEHKDIQVWWMIFTAYAAVYGFADSVQNTRYPDFRSGEDTVINLATTGVREKLKSKKMIVIAVDNLNMAFTSESLICIVYQARTTKWTSGMAPMVVNELFKTYFLQDLVSKINLRRALNAVIMKKEEDPANLFEAIRGIKNKL